VVEEISHVQSVDLVADPATTKGLFEEAAAEVAVEEPTAEETLPEDALAALTVEQLRERRPDLAERLVAEGVERGEASRPRSREQMAGLARSERVETASEFARAIGGRRRE
jgi:hypothetical protein